MTVTNQTVREVFAGPIGAAENVNTSIPFFETSDLILEIESSGSTVTWALGVNYTLTGGSGGGTITTISTVAADENLVVVRRLPLTQPIDLQNQGALLPAAIEEALDRLLLLHLDNDDTALRAVTADPAELNPTGLVMPDLATRANQLCGWDALGEISAISPDDVLPADIDPVTLFGKLWVGTSDGVTARSLIGFNSGDTTALAAATPTLEAIFFTTDTLEVYIGNGVSWDLMSASQATVVKPNLIINGSAQINQRVNCTSTSQYDNTDFSFCLDHVLVVSDTGGGAVVSQESTIIPDGGVKSFKINCAISSKKHGLMFPLDSSQAASLISSGNDKVCSFRFKHRASRAMNLRAQVASFQGGTVDELTDPIADAAWGAAGTLPTLSAGWTWEGGGAEFASSTSWATKEATNIAIDTASTKNLALIIWADDLDMVASTDSFYLAEVQLHEGSALAPYSPPTFEEEFSKCQRFYRKTFDQSVEPGSNRGQSGALAMASSYSRTSGGDHYGVKVEFPFPMFKAPTVTLYNPSASGASWYNASDTATQGSGTARYAGDSGFFVELNVSNGFNPGEQCVIHYDAVAEIVA
jgi:hypothetical protein